MVLIGKPKSLEMNSFNSLTFKLSLINKEIINFNQNQKNATIKAGEIAGFKKIDLMSEPNAAAITYGLEKKSKEKRNICIFDFGGGTFDVTILEIENMVFKNKAIGGDSHLGGED